MPYPIAFPIPSKNDFQTPFPRANASNLPITIQLVTIKPIKIAEPGKPVQYVANYKRPGLTTHIPVDDGATQGDVDNDASNYATWYQIGGTYSPNASTKQVSFEIVIVGDPDGDVNTPSTNSNPNPNVYIDYVNLVAQPFDADFAQSLADSRITTNVGTFSGSGGYSGMNIAQALNLSITSLQQDESDLADENATSTKIRD